MERFGDAVAAEWLKLRTLRSTRLATYLGVLAVLVIAAIACGVQAHQFNTDGGVGLGFDPVAQSLRPWFLGQLVLGTVGVLAITNEYGNAMITTTFMAMPRRREVLAAKAVVLGVAVLVVAEITSFVAFFMGQALLSSASAGISIADGGALRAVIGAGLYITLVALLGLGLGAMVRHTAGGVAALFGLLLLPTLLATALPSTWERAVRRYAPLNAGIEVFRVGGGGRDLLSPWIGFGVCAIWVAVALALGAWLIQVRDA